MGRLEGCLRDRTEAMKNALSTLVEFWHILWNDTPLHDRYLIGGGWFATPALTLSHITAVIGWVVGIVTIIFTVIRIIISLEELRDRRQQRRERRQKQEEVDE